LALGILNEALGLRMPILAVPFVNIGLAQHPAFIRSIRDLGEAGVQLIFDPQKHPLPLPNQGPSSRGLFPWDEVRRQLPNLRGRAARAAW
jgi:hypothetical protein